MWVDKQTGYEPCRFIVEPLFSIKQYVSASERPCLLSPGVGDRGSSVLGTSHVARRCWMLSACLLAHPISRVAVRSERVVWYLVGSGGGGSEGVG